MAGCAVNHVLKSVMLVKIVVVCALITIESSFVPFPAALVALTVKAYIPTVVGVPEIMPVSASVKPVGKDEPVSRVHVMGVSPVAASVWLYAVPAVPLVNVSVVIVGDVMIVIEKIFLLFPMSLVALTWNVDVPDVVGVPEITPSVESVKPVGNVPVSMSQIMGVSPVAVNVWLYTVPVFPSGNVAVVIVGAVPPPRRRLSHSFPR